MYRFIKNLKIQTENNVDSRGNLKIGKIMKPERNYLKRSTKSTNFN